MTEGAYRCPKCRGEMTSGTISGNLRIVKQGDLMGDRMYVYYCMDCGFIELYKEASMKETRRWRTQAAPAQESTAEKPQKPKESEQEEESKARKEKRLVR